MIYVFDTSSIRSLQHFYPGIFRSVWTGMDELVKEGQIISVRESWNELERQNISDDLKAWVKKNKRIFLTPSIEELQMVRDILSNSLFRSLIGEKQRLRGDPVADPFVIALAKVREATVVTEERFKKGAAKIPNVCAHYKIRSMNLETFMLEQGWSF